MLEVERGVGIWLQPRDFEILAFCLEMKFADVETLNGKFFDANSEEMFAARKRIQKIESQGYLKSISMLAGSARKYYITTAKGYRELLKSDGGTALRPRPVTKLSVVTFEHDLFVLQARIKLERQGRAHDWISERLLKTQASATSGSLSRYFLPDGMFTSKKGQRCAFEFENKPKSEDQLREKIFRLKAVMESHEAPFTACLIVASSDALKVKIQRITESIPNRFIVQAMSELSRVDK